MWNKQELYKSFFRAKCPDTLWDDKLRDTTKITREFYDKFNRSPWDDKLRDTTKITRELYDKFNRGEITNPEAKNFVELSIKRVFEKYNHGEITNENEKQYIFKLSKEIREKCLTESINNFDGASEQALIQLANTVDLIRFEFIPLPFGMVPLSMYLIEDFRTFLSQNVNFDYGNYSVVEEGTEAWTLGILKAMRDIYWRHATESDCCQLYTRQLRIHNHFNDMGLQRLDELDLTLITSIANHDLAHLSARQECMGKLLFQKMENSNSDILQCLAEKTLLNYSSFFGHDLVDLTLDLAVGLDAF